MLVCPSALRSLGTACRLWSAIAVAACTVVSCVDTSESNIVAQVGESRLTTAEVRMLVPMDLHGYDSAVFVQQYVDRWIDEHLMYEQGLRNLGNLQDIEEQVADYRARLVAQNYENQLLRTRVGTVDDDECRAYYDQHGAEMRLSVPVVQGVLVKLLANSSKAKTIQQWFGELLAGRTDCIEELETYAMQRAVLYDNFFDEWVELQRLTDNLPVAVAEPRTFLARKVYVMNDDDFVYLFVVRDYRLAGDQQPYEYALPDIREILMQQQRQQMHDKLLDDLRAEAGIAPRRTETTSDNE